LDSHSTGRTRPILDLKVATIARNVARLCATFHDFPRLWIATLRDFIENIVNDRKTLILMTSFFFVLRPSATFRDLPRIFATLVRDFGRDYAKVKSRIGLALIISLIESNCIVRTSVVANGASVSKCTPARPGGRPTWAAGPILSNYRLPYCTRTGVRRDPRAPPLGARRARLLDRLPWDITVRVLAISATDNRTLRLLAATETSSTIGPRCRVF
jgi:hypothetical protein